MLCVSLVRLCLIGTGAPLSTSCIESVAPTEPLHDVLSHSDVSQTLRDLSNAPDSKIAVMRPIEAARFWKSIHHHRMPKESFQKFLRPQLRTLNVIQRLYVTSHSNRRRSTISVEDDTPYHIYRALSHLPQKPWWPLAERLEQDSRFLIHSCRSLVQVAQLLRRWDREAAIGVEGRPLLADAWRHIFGLAANEKGVPSHEVLAFVLQHATLAFHNWQPYWCKADLTQRAVAACGSLGQWDLALELVRHKVRADGSPARWLQAPSSAQRGLREYVENGARWKSAASLVSEQEVSECMRSSHAWDHALKAASLWTTATRRTETLRRPISWLSMANSFCDRADAPWDAALSLLSHVLQQRHEDSPPTHIRWHRVTSVLWKKPLPQHHDEIWQHVDFLRRCLEQTSQQELRAADSLVGMSTAVKLLRSSAANAAAAAPRWDAAMAVLLAARHTDVAIPLVPYIGALEHLPTDVMAFLKVRDGNECNTSESALTMASSGEVADGVVLATLLLKGRVPMKAVSSISSLLKHCSPRTQTLYLCHAASQQGWLPAAADENAPLVLHGCYAFQSHAASKLVLEAASATHRRHFSAAINALPHGDVVRSSLERIFPQTTTPRVPIAEMPITNSCRDTMPIDIASLSAEEAQSIVSFVLRGSHISPALLPLMRRLLVQPKAGDVIEDTVVIDSEEVWKAFLYLIVRSCGDAPLVHMEGALLWHTAELFAAGLVDAQSLSEDARCLCMLEVLAGHALSHLTVLEIAGPLPLEVIRERPLAAAVTATAFALGGAWERALLLFQAPLRTAPTTSLQTLQFLRDTWVEIACSTPDDDVRQRYGRMALVMSAPKHLPHESILRRILESLWRRDSRPISQWLAHWQQQQRSPDSTFKLMLSAALLTLDTRSELFPVAWAIGRPLTQDDVGVLALRRVVTSVSWQRALEMMGVLRESQGVMQDAWLLDVYERWALPSEGIAAALRLTEGLSPSLSKCRGIWSSSNGAAHCVLRCEQHLRANRSDVVEEVAKWLRRLAETCSKHAHQLHLPISGRLLVSIASAMLHRVDAEQSTPFHHALVAHHNGMRSVATAARQLCEVQDPSLLRLGRRRLPSVFVDGGAVALQLTFLAMVAARKRQVDVAAKVPSTALRVASAAGTHDWMAALYFFSQLRHPRPEEYRNLFSSLASPSWQVALRVLRFQPKIVDHRPDLTCMGLASLVAHCTQRASTETDGDADHAMLPNERWPPPVQTLWEDACRVADAPVDCTTRMGEVNFAMERLRRATTSADVLGPTPDENALMPRRFDGSAAYESLWRAAFRLLPFATKATEMPEQAMRDTAVSNTIVAHTIQYRNVELARQLLEHAHHLMADRDVERIKAMALTEDALVGDDSADGYD